MTAHLAQGVVVFTAADVWWWKEEKEEYDEGRWYMVTALHGPYEVGRDAYLAAPKEDNS